MRRYVGAKIRRTVVMPIGWTYPWWLSVGVIGRNGARVELDWRCRDGHGNGLPGVGRSIAYAYMLGEGT